MRGAGLGAPGLQCLLPGLSDLGMNVMQEAAAAHLKVFRRLLVHQLAEDNVF